MNAYVIIVLSLFCHEIVSSVEPTRFSSKTDKSEDQSLPDSTSRPSSLSSSKPINLELTALNSDINTFQNEHQSYEISPKLLIDLSSLNDIPSIDDYSLQDLSFLRGERSNEVISEDYFMDDFRNEFLKSYEENNFHPSIDHANDMDNNLYPNPSPPHQHPLPAFPFHLSTGNDALSDYFDQIERERLRNSWSTSPYDNVLGQYHGDIPNPWKNDAHFSKRAIPHHSRAWPEASFRRQHFARKKPVGVSSANKGQKSMLVRRLKRISTPDPVRPEAGRVELWPFASRFINYPDTSSSPQKGSKSSMKAA